MGDSVITETVDDDLESQEFRTALLARLNGQSEEMQRLIKLVDVRFVSQRRRILTLERTVSRLADDVRFVRRLLSLLAGLAGILASLATVLEAWP